MVVLETAASLAVAKSVDFLADLAKTIVSNMYLYFEAVKDAPRRSEELRLELASVCGLLDSLYATLTQSTISSECLIPSAAIKSAVAQFQVTLNEINARVSVGQLKGLGRLKWPFSKEENERILTRLERYKATFNMALSIKCL
jgi:hypothetical protein